MSGAKRKWIAFAAAAALEIAALAPIAAIGAPLAARDGGARSALPDATPLARFYPAPLLSSPGNGVEDQEVWLAKVRGLMAGAPALLQQSLLASQNAQDFSANLALLQQMQEGMLKQAGLQLQMLAKPGAAGTKVLGSSNNLVYTALNACRIMDTRNAAGASGVQGPLAGNTLYHIPGYITAGTDWSVYGQTGTLSDCGLTSAVGGNIYAVAIVITVLNPNFDAFLGVSQSSALATTLSTVAVNFTHGQGISTLYIVPQTSTNTIYFAMPAGLSGGCHLRRRRLFLAFGGDAAGLHDNSGNHRINRRERWQRVP